MIWPGPSGTGKTETALLLANLLNKKGTEHFIKIDCGKLTDETEFFGMAGAYQGSKEGSALNNFVLQMSSDVNAHGVVLLDEIEKAKKGVIHGLYQVFDRGEWTNKKLHYDSSAQTESIPCGNLIFIMTTNACDEDIVRFARERSDVYTSVMDEFEEIGSELAARVRRTLQHTQPFTEAFIGRVGRIVPFLPLADGDPEVHHPLLCERMTIAKLLIEKEQEKYSKSKTTEVHQIVDAKHKHQIARIATRGAIQEAGVRAIQQEVEAVMGDRMIDALLLEKGGIQQGSHVRYFVKEGEQKVDYRVEQLPGGAAGKLTPPDQKSGEENKGDKDDWYF